MTRRPFPRPIALLFLLACIGTPCGSFLAAAVAQTDGSNPTETPPSHETGRAVLFERVAKVLQAVEVWETEQAGQGGLERLAGMNPPPPMSQELIETDAALAQHLTQSPRDLDALLWQARLLRAEYGVRPSMVTLQGGHATRRGRDYIAEMLDTVNRALAMAPDNAEAYYWRAWALTAEDAWIRDDGTYVDGPRDMTQAIDSARHAVSLAPTKWHYREALGIYLARAGRNPEAMAVLGSGPDGANHLLRRLLQDEDLIPVPAGAIRDAERSTIGANVIFRDSGLARRFPWYPWRLTVYHVHLSPAEVEAFYQARWRGFQLFDTRDSRQALVHWNGEQLSGSVPVPENNTVEFLRNLTEPGLLVVVAHDPAAASWQTLLGLINLR
jgi:hypothetical protein